MSTFAWMIFFFGILVGILCGWLLRCLFENRYKSVI